MPESKKAPKGKGKEEEVTTEVTEETIPNDIKPIFVATQGQQIFGCVADEDVTSENPYKLIPKEQILQDFLNRAGVSDFKVAKSVINVCNCLGRNVITCFCSHRAILVKNCY